MLYDTQYISNRLDEIDVGDRIALVRDGYIGWFTIEAWHRRW